MPDLNCIRCGQKISSKKDLTIGYSYNFHSIIRPYHKKCFTEKHDKEKFAPTATINPNNLGMQKNINYLSIAGIILITLYGIFYNYNKGWIWTLPFIAILFSYFPITSLFYIQKIRKLS